MTETQQWIPPVERQRYTETETDVFRGVTPVLVHRIEATSLWPWISTTHGDVVERMCHYLISALPQDGQEEALGQLVEILKYYVVADQGPRRLEQTPGATSVEVDLGESLQPDPWYLESTD
jgi:hypothetical protein